MEKLKQDELFYLHRTLINFSTICSMTMCILKKEMTRDVFHKVGRHVNTCQSIFSNARKNLHC